MRGKVILQSILMGVLAVGLTACSDGKDAQDKENQQDTEIKTAFDETAQGLEEGEAALQKSASNNPIVGGMLKTEELVYTADPSILVDGDTVYLYAGHDQATDEQAERKIYSIPEYICYSTKDLKEWKAEGVVFRVNPEVNKWVRDSGTAWASQVVKHYDKKAGKDKYYLYYCSWDRTSQGKQSIGVAVADKAAGE
ncbi:MAG: family 43 glycosylhydrolase, partial [Ruminococcus flavefaciens]|nr:family 43 glycosylhydrolase [Ruminococcus flavefaciens]